VVIPGSLPFGGTTYDPTLDSSRLGTQLAETFRIMRDGQWRTLSEIAREVKGSEAGISARLRDLRKHRFGSYTVERRRRSVGTWEYKLITIFDEETRSCAK